MNNRKRLATASLFLAGALLSGCDNTDGLPGLSCHLAADWATVDDFSPSVNTGNQGNAVTSDFSGRIFTIGGETDSSGFNHWMVRTSPDRGASWTTTDDFQLDAASDTYQNGIIADDSGNVFAVGNPFTSSNSVSHWTVRKTADGGTTWTTVDDLTSAEATVASYSSSTGLNVFGVLQTGADPWSSRVSLDGGSTWKSGDSFNLSVNSTQPLGAAADLAGNLYTVGFSQDSAATPLSHWIVRKSKDGGATWATADDFQLDPTTDSSASAVVADPVGNIYVVGHGADASGDVFWVVRKSTDAGVTWTTVRSHQPTSGNDASASSVGFDNLGAIYVAGQANDASDNGQWLVEKSSDDGASWATVDSFLYSGTQGTGLSGIAQGFAYTPTGDLYVTGQVTLTATGNPTRWVTRKLSCN